MTIHKIFLLKDGILLIDKNFSSKLKVEMRLVKGFLSAIQSFSQEMTGSSMRSMNFENLTFHFYMEKKVPGLIYVIITDLDYNLKEVNCKIMKISSLFFDNYSKHLSNFSGDVAPFESFDKTLDTINIDKKYCGDREKCTFCSYRGRRSIIIDEDKSHQDLIEQLQKWLKLMINKVPELLTGIVMDVDGFIITEYSKNQNNENQLELILRIIEPIIEKIKATSDKSLTSGSLDTDDFHLFYLELGGQNPALLVFVSDPDYNIKKSLPYTYLIAENISSVLNGRPTSHILPEVRSNGSLHLNLPQDKDNSKPLNYKIFVVGEPRCGKTSLLNMFINNQVDKQYKPTIGLSIYEKKYQISKYIQINFMFFDVGGLKTFSEVRKDYYNLTSPDTIIFMFDFDNYSQSINRLKDFMEESFFYFGNIPENIILVGNKIDKVRERSNLQKKISHIQEQYNCAYFETSAINGEGMDEIFTYLISNMDLNYELVS